MTQQIQFKSVLLKVRKGATAGFNAKRWTEALGELGYVVAFQGHGRDRKILVTNGDGEMFEDYCKGFYKLGKWLSDRGIKAAASKALGMPTVEDEKAEKENKARDWVNTGTCAICGMNVKMREGKLVLHGYQRPGWGSIQGSCFGVNWPPYETSNGVCLAYMLDCKDHLKLTGAKLVEVCAEDYAEDYYVRANHRRDPAVAVKKGEPRWHNLWENNKISLASKIRGLKSDIVIIDQRIKDWKPSAKMPEEIAREKGWLK